MLEISVAVPVVIWGLLIIFLEPVATQGQCVVKKQSVLNALSLAPAFELRKEEPNLVSETECVFPLPFSCFQLAIIESDSDTCTFYYLNLVKEIFLCFDKNSDQPINVTLSCKSSQVINVINAKYGYNRWSACLSAVAPGDCTEAMFEADECNKQNSCKLSVKNIYSFKCGEVNYFRIIYSCNEVNPLRILQNYQRRQLTTTTTPKLPLKNPEILPSILPSTSWKRQKDPYKIDNSEKVIFAICVTVTGIALTLCLTVIVIQCCSHKRKNHNTEEMLPDEISIVLTEMQRRRRPSADGAPPEITDSKDIDQSTELNPEDDSDSPPDIRQRLRDCSQRWNLYHIVRQQIWRLKSRTAPEGHSPTICTVSQNIDSIV